MQPLFLHDRSLAFLLQGNSSSGFQDIVVLHVNSNICVQRHRVLLDVKFALLTTRDLFILFGDIVFPLREPIVVKCLFCYSR